SGWGSPEPHGLSAARPLVTNDARHRRDRRSTARLLGPFEPRRVLARVAEAAHLLHLLCGALQAGALRRMRELPAVEHDAEPLDLRRPLQREVDAFVRIARQVEELDRDLFRAPEGRGAHQLQAGL